MCKFALKSIEALQREADGAEVPLRLLLNGALVIDKMPAQIAQKETIAYEYISRVRLVVCASVRRGHRR